MPVPPLSPHLRDGTHSTHTRRRSSLSVIKNLEELSLEEDDDKPQYCYRCSRERKNGQEELNTQRKMRRRSSGHSLMGSFQESILSGRTAGFASEPIPFTAKIGVFPTVPDSERRFYKPLTVPFEALFYNWSSEADVVETPYVGGIDLENFYIDRESQRQRDEQQYSKTQTPPKKRRKFPGFLLPQSGVLQIVIFNKERTICNFNVVKYDLSELPKNHKTIIRKNNYVLVPPKRDNVNPKAEPSSKPSEKTLVSTIEVKFANINDRNYYVYDTIKVIFHNRAFPTNLNGSDDEKMDSVSHSGYSSLDVDYYTRFCEACDEEPVGRPVFKVSKYADVFSEDDQ